MVTFFIPLYALGLVISVPNTGFLLAEDAAIKNWFSQITVTDDRDISRPVKVFFRYPDNETERAYPFATIELIDIVHAVGRQHSEVTLYGSTSTAASAQMFGPGGFTYVPSVSPNLVSYASMGPLVSTQEFIPVDLLYQISTFTRSALHDRQIISTMLHNLTQFRSTYITVPEDGTIRRFQLLDWINADLLDPEAGYRKRIFRKVYTVQLGAEMRQTDVVAAQRALTITTDIINTNDDSTETVTVS